MGITEQLARFATAKRENFLTPELAESAKAKFLDTLGVMIAGAHAPAGLGGPRHVADIRTVHRAPGSSWREHTYRFDNSSIL